MVRLGSEVQRDGPRTVCASARSSRSSGEAGAVAYLTVPRPSHPEASWELTGAKFQLALLRAQETRGALRAEDPTGSP